MGASLSGVYTKGPPLLSPISGVSERPIRRLSRFMTRIVNISHLDEEELRPERERERLVGVKISNSCGMIDDPCESVGVLAASFPT